jgi:hypothetical protein
MSLMKLKTRQGLGPSCASTSRFPQSTREGPIASHMRSQWSVSQLSVVLLRVSDQSMGTVVVVGGDATAVLR